MIDRGAGHRREYLERSVIEHRPTSVLVIKDGIINKGQSEITDRFPAISEVSFAEWLTRASVREAPPQTGGSVHSCVIELEAEEGPRWYCRYGVPTPDLDVSRLEIFQDVTAAVETADRLDLFKRVAASTQDGLFAADEDGKVLYCNESYAAILGETQAAIRDSHLLEYIDSKDGQKLERTLDRLANSTDSSQVVELTVEADQRSVIEFQLSEWSDHRGGYVGIARDITDRKRRERRLEQYRTLVESAGDPMYVVDADGTIELVNTAMIDLFDTTRDELVGQHISNIFEDETVERNREAIDNIRASEQPWDSYELAIEAGTGQTRWFEATVGVVQADDGELRGSVTTLREMTARRRQEQDIEQLKRTLSAVARNNLDRELTEMTEVASNLAAEADGPAVDYIDQSVEELTGLPEKVGVIEQIVDTDPEPVAQNLRQLVTDAVTSVREELTTGEIEIEIPAGTTVCVIPRFTLAIENLVENALEYAGPEPIVTIEAEETDDSVTLTVSDDGPGIPEAELAVLERGEETQLKHSSGVGLWVVDWAVRRSGATSFYFEDGGASIAVELDRPASDSTTDTEGDPRTDETLTPTQQDDQVVSDDELRVLYVDKKADAIARVKEYIETETEEITLVGTTDHAVAVDHLTGGDVDCLVAEQLPDNDWEQLLDATPDIPVVLYTDADYSGLDEKTFEPIDTLVQKGFDESNGGLLVGKIRAVTKVTDKSSAEDGNSPRETVAQAGQRTMVQTLEGQQLTATTVDAPLEQLRESAGQDGTAVIVTDGATGRVYSYRRYSIGEPTVELVQDVTATVTQARNKDLLETLIQQINDGISVVDGDGSISYHNDAFSDILGYDDMVGNHAGMFMMEGELERMQRAVQRLLASPSLQSEVHDIDMVTADGAVVTVADHFTIRYSNGEYAGVINVARDITERKRRERYLEQYRTLVESAGDPMCVFDADGNVELVNEAMVSFTGLTRETLLESDAGILLDAEKIEQRQSAIRATLADEERTATTFETTFNDDDRERHFEVTVGTITDGDEFVGSVSTFREITARKRRTAELTRLKQVLDRILRHDLRNELMIIMGQATMLTEQVDGATRQTAQGLIDRCERLLRTVDNARTVEKTIETDPTIVSHELATVVNQALEMGPTELPDDVQFRGRHELPTVLRSLAVTLSDGDHPTSPIIEIDEQAIRLQFPAADGELPSVPDGPATVPFEDETALQLWLARWLVNSSGGSLRLDADGIQIQLQRP